MDVFDMIGVLNNDNLKGEALDEEIKKAKAIRASKGGMPYKGKLKPDQLVWLKENVEGKRFSELTILFNSHFKANYTSKQIQNFCVYNRFYNCMPRVEGGHYWTEEELSFLEKHAENNTNKEITALLNKAFNLSLTRQQVRYATFNYKIKVKEQSPVKCTEEIATFLNEYPEKSNRDLTVMINNTFGTAFTKMQIARFRKYYKYRALYKNHTHEVPLYSERVKRSGHIYIKISMTGPQNERWKEKHRWIWEKAYGKIPLRMEIIFLDNNPQNCTLENLAMLTKAEKLHMGQKYLFSDDREVTLAGIAIVRHSLAIHNRIKKTFGIEEHKKFVSRESEKRTRKRKKKVD